MVTSMETWIIADQDALRKRFGPGIDLNQLPSTHKLEARSRQSILGALKAATAHCPQPYANGKVSFQLVGLLSPTALTSLPSFARVAHILNQRL
jgi:hypothetical protein